MTIALLTREDILDAWDSLTLTAFDPLPLDKDMVGAIVSETNDPVPLLKFRPETEATLRRLARSNTSSPEDRRYICPFEGSNKPEFESLRERILGDFKEAARALFPRLEEVKLEMRVGLFDKARAPYLHSDGRYCGDGNVWNLTGRTEALPMWVARQAKLKRADPVLVDAARFNDERSELLALLPVEEVSVRKGKRTRAVSALKAQGIVTPLDLGIIYLMRNSRGTRPGEEEMRNYKSLRDEDDGCQHMSSLVTAPAYSGFFRSGIHCGFGL